MDQAGDAIAQIRRTLRERADAEAARTRDRVERRARLFPLLRRGATVVTGRLARSVFPFLARLVRWAAHTMMDGARQVAHLSIGLIRRAARRSVALIDAAVRLSRTRLRVKRRAHASPPPVPGVPAHPADPAVERERSAEEFERRRLSIREAALGPDHPDVGLLTYILATRCAARGADEEARSLYERTLRIFATAFGPDHAEVEAVLNDLVELHSAAGRDVEAASCAMRAAHIAGRRRDRLYESARAATEVVTEPAR